MQSSASDPSIQSFPTLRPQPPSPHDLFALATGHTDVIDPNFDEFDHDSHMRRTLERAREAADRGDRPFGSVFVRDDTIVMADANHVLTANDIRHHPEITLVYRACREFDPDTRAETVMYTSTEPCPMCAGEMATAEFGRVVYSVGSDEMAEFTGNKTSARSAEILNSVSDVVGLT